MFREDISYGRMDAAETLSLAPEQIAKAAALSTLVCPLQQWQTYLNALAWAGVQNWFQYRSPDLRIESETSVLTKPALMNLVPAVGPIYVNGFSLTIIASDLMAASLLLPRGIVEIPTLMTHFYLWVDVREEASEVRIAGVLEHEQLQHLRSSLDQTDHWQYSLPVTAFSSDTGHFLRLLHCGTPDMIPLNLADAYSTAEQSTAEQPIESLWQPLLSLQSSTPAPWEILSWAQAKFLLNNPPLSHWLVSDWPSIAIAQRELQRRLAQLLTPVINVAHWLETTVDTVASAWTPVPQVLVSELRGSESNGNPLFNPLGIEFTHAAQAMVRDISVGEQTVQLYGIAQPEPAQYGLPHWSLCLIISAQDNMRLPRGMQMHLTDSADLHLYQTVNGDNPERYLFIQVMGTWTERFWVTVNVPGSPALELEPFAWQPA